MSRLQGLGITGNLLSWIKDYLANRHQVTIVQGCCSSLRKVSFDVPQGSVLGPTLFSIFTNDLPGIVSGNEGNLHMYADDTTIYVTGPTPDTVTSKLNLILGELTKWCRNNQLTPHSGKTEFMLMQRGSFIGP